MIVACDGRFEKVNLNHLRGGKRVTLGEPIYTKFGVIPVDFECDLDSVPRHAGPLYAWMKGRTKLAAIVHDYCYRNRVPRKEADQYFLEVMEWECVRKRYRLPIYWAVRLFGRFSYHK